MITAADTIESDKASPDGSIGTSLPTTRSAPAAVLTVIGCCCVILGGLVAAVTEPLDLAHGSWVAAYLVLVGGVAQFAMGRARTWHPAQLQTRSWGWAQIGAWNLGNALVICGTLTTEPLLVDLGSAALFTALGIAFNAASTRADRTARPAAGTVSPVLTRTYRLVLLVLAVSIPVGIVLSHLRNS